MREAAMADRDRARQDNRNDATETRLQVDPALRAGRVPWGWTIAMAAALVAIAVVLFATNREDSDDTADMPAVETPVTTGAPSEPPERGTTGSRQ